MAEQSPGVPCGSHRLSQGFYSASSSSSVAAMDDYDVFLNHRGPDVKGCFVSHLYDALKSAGLNPFLDKKSLVKGGHAWGSIDAALEVARVHVVVVSEGYAESKHCLSELVVMMRSGKPVIPVFYDVEPGHLRQAKSGTLFGEAFEKHKARERAEQVEEWADALGKLADITGFRFQLCDYKGNRDEAELKRDVVDVVLSLMPTREDLLIDPHLVAIEDHLKTCINKLEGFGSGTSLLGLVGMGGVGKTILAKVIRHHLLGNGKQFQATSFLEIGRVTPYNIDMAPRLTSRLQKQLLWDLLRVPENSQHPYAYWFGTLARRGPVLIVIDDLCHRTQFDDLILSTKHLAHGSCIIAISRDRHVLNVVGVVSGWNYYLHEVTPLESNDSQKLFNWHAFGKEEAPELFKTLADNVSKACGGLPLALKMVGSSLFDKRSDEDLAYIWPEAVDALRENPSIMGALKWSYNHLMEPEKLMFMDVACVFYGWKKEEALEIWKGCRFKTPYFSLQRLIEKSLVVLVKDRGGGGDRLVVHTLLRDMGQSIGRVNGSHVWEDGASMVLEKFHNAHRLRALNLSNNSRRNFEADDLTKFTNLHYLILDGCNVNGSFRSVLKELRWLQWRNIPLHQPPLSMLDLSNLISLDFSGSTMLAGAWAGLNPALEACPNLLRLNLSECSSITMLPDSIGCLSQLQVLNLNFCKGLQELPSSIGKLASLKELWLGGCVNLEALPTSFIGLSSLQSLSLADCSSLITLPMSLGLMKRLLTMGIDLATKWQVSALGQLNKGLKTLGVRRCNNEAITMLDSLGVLTHVDELCYIRFIKCPAMTKLPETMGLLTNLEFLELDKCEKVLELPESIKYLKELKQLCLKDCNNLESLPDSLDALSSLQFLVIAKCTSISKLPSSIGKLSRLRELNILGCSRLVSLPESLKYLSSLRFLAIMECGNLEGLHVIKALQGLRMWGCTAMSNLPGSCLIVRDGNWKEPRWYFDYNVWKYLPIHQDLTELQVVEVNDCGVLRMVDDGTSRLILQRVCRQPCSHM